MSERVVISKKLVAINSASTLATRLLSITVLVWLQQYLLKRISPSEYSLLPILFSIMMVAPLIITILSGGLKRYVLDAYARDDDDRITQIVSTFFPLLCVAALCLGAVGIVVAWHIDWLLKIAPEYVSDARLMLVLLIFSSSFQLVMEAFGSGLFVRQRFVLQNLVELGAECCRISLLFALLFGVSTSVVWVVVASVCADLVRTIAITVFSRRFVPAQRFQSSRINWPVARELIHFGGWSSLDGFAGTIRKAADVIILNRLATPLDVTCFHLGALVPNRMEILINNAFANTVAPVVIGMHSLSQTERLKRLYLRLGRLALWGLMLVVAPLLIYHEQIVRLYVGDTFLSAGTVMFLLLACYPIVYGNILYGGLAKAKVRVRSLAIRNSLSAVANLVLTLVLVGHYELGAVGAAAATFVTYGAGSILLLWPLGKGLAGATWREIWQEILLPGLTPFLTALIVMRALIEIAPIDSWMDLAVHAAMGGCAYLVVLWFVTKEIDRRQLKEFAGYFLGRTRIRPGTEIE